MPRCLLPSNFIYRSSALFRINKHNTLLIALYPLLGISGLGTVWDIVAFVECRMSDVDADDLAPQV